MNKIWIKIALPVAALALGVAGMMTINATAKQDTDKKAVDVRPIVKIESAHAQDYQVMINSYGEVKPLESTMLAAQVSGEVVNWNPNFVAGGLVRRGDILFQIENDSYQAALLQAESELSLAQAQLIEEKARANVALQETKNMPASKVTDLYLRKPQLLSAQAKVKSAEAGLKIAQRNLDNCDIRAPYDALVVTRDFGLGQYLNQGAQVAEIYNVETAEIIFPIAGFDNAFLPEQLAGKIATVSTEGTSSIARQGTISRDIGLIDKATRMSQLVVRVEDPYSLQTESPRLKFGSYVEVSFVGQTLNNIYRLPQELVTNRIVWVVNDEQKLESHKVEVLREDGAYFLVSSGLADEDKLVTTLPEYPQNGMLVKIDGVDDQAPVAQGSEELVAQQSN
jgi:membrane fusion protein, multidrug efflux system